LERFKLFRLNQLAALREKHHFPSAAVIEGSPWPIKPPVIEVGKDGKLVVVDGAHRAFAAYSRGAKELQALVVEGASMPLPATPTFGWDSVRILTQKVPRAERYNDFKPEFFRPIRAAFATLSNIILQTETR
jgi:hypothetical protein